MMLHDTRRCKDIFKFYLCIIICIVSNHQISELKHVRVHVEAIYNIDIKSLFTDLCACPICLLHCLWQAGCKSYKGFLKKCL